MRRIEAKRSAVCQYSTNKHRCPGEKAGRRRKNRVRTSQPEAGGHAPEHVPHDPRAVERVCVEQRQRARDDRVREHRVRVQRRLVVRGARVRVPHGQAEEQEELREGGIEQRERDVRVPVCVHATVSKLREHGGRSRRVTDIPLGRSAAASMASSARRQRPGWADVSHGARRPPGCGWRHRCRRRRRCGNRRRRGSSLARILTTGRT